MQRKILLVEDEEALARTVANFLGKEGFRVAVAPDGPQALSQLRAWRPDLVLLDWMLPGMSGLEVFRMIQREMDLPVIMVTARSDETDRLLGLELGADDYIVKPFSLRELAARVRAVLRRYHRSEGSPSETLVAGDLVIDLAGKAVSLAGQPVTLTPSEFKILATLARSPGRVYSRLQLLEAALGGAYEGYERSVDTHISNLRRKIEPDPANPSYILTVFGMGYKFIAPGRRSDRGSRGTERGGEP